MNQRKPFEALFSPRVLNLIHCLALSSLMLLVFAPDPGLCNRSHSAGQPSPSAAYNAYERLRKDKNASREAWLKVVSSLLIVHKTGQKQQAPKALLFAGRAAMACYEKSGKPEDLEKAIRCLNLLIKEYEKSPYFIPGLKELKKAHELKIQLPLESKTGGPSTVPRSSGRQEIRQIVPSKDGEETPSALPNPSTTGTSTDAQSQSAHVQVYPLVLSTRAGNPFYDSLGTARTSAPLREPVPVSEPIPVQTVKPMRQEKALLGATEYVVVIDPGHGGKDPGAVSPDGSVKEKDFTLELAFKIENRLKEVLPEARVVLTRRDDAHLALTERTEAANSHNANLFLSIHGNAFDDPQARGVETFYLSSANSRGSMRVAARENGISLARMTDLQATLIDLNVTAKKAESAALAQEVQHSLVSFLRERGYSTRDRGVKTAPFYVLLGAKMPAILVECAFITNMNDRDSLTRSDKLDSISEGIARGTANYLKAIGDKGPNRTVTTCGVPKTHDQPK
jgi:N-acetylmuramoyl-L-alanine amidase